MMRKLLLRLPKTSFAQFTTRAMPIERRYDQPGLDTILSALLIEQQQKKAERERAAATAQALAGGGNGQPTGYSTGPQGPAYAPTNRISQGYGRERNGIDLTRVIGDYWQTGAVLEGNRNNNYTRLLQTQMEQEAENQRELMQQAGLDERNSLNQAIELDKQYTDDIPQHIQEGLANYQIRYNPIIQRQIDKESEERARIIADKRLRDSEKAWAVAEKDRKIRWLRTQTEPFPPNERPVTPQQQFEQGVVTDGPTGQRGLLGNRNGEITFNPIKDEKQAEQIKRDNALALQAQKAADAQRLEAIKAANKTEIERIKSGSKDKSGDLLKRRDAMYKDWTDSIGDLNNAKENWDKLNAGENVLNSKGQPVQMSSEAAFVTMNSAAERARYYKSQVDEIGAELAAIKQAKANPTPPSIPIPLTPSPLLQPPAQQPQAPPSANGPPDWYLKLPPGAKYIDPTGVERIKQ